MTIAAFARYNLLMNSRFVGTLLSVIVLACVATGIIVYPHLQTVFVSHWNASGYPNGTMSKFWGVVFMPALMLIFIGVWALLPRIDPIVPGFRGFRRVYDFFFFMTISFLAYVYALTLGANLGWQFNMLTALLPALAIFIFTLGALLPYIPRNWFIGIRTPWTISNAAVWDKTHRLGRVLFEIAAACILAGTFVSRPVALWLTLVSLGAAVLVSVVYSYLLFSRTKIS